MKKVAITGPTGLVGSRIIELLSRDFEFYPITHSMIDVADAMSVRDVFASLNVDMFIHLAAYTNVDMAERERNLAHAINVEGTRNLFDNCRVHSIPFIYMSTDFVFDGQDPPYVEKSEPNPVGYYGVTKYEGEKVVADQGMIVRIAYPYRSHYEMKSDFMRTIRSLLQRGRTIDGITDSIFTPTFIDDVAYGLRHLVNNYTPDIYHLVGSQSLSPYDAFVAIANTFDLDDSLITKTTYAKYFKGKARRPKNSQIISRTNDFWKMEGFEDCLRKIRSST